MTTAIDTNILVALWNEDDSLNTRARVALDAALEQGSLVIAAPVYAELLSFPGRSEGFLDAFFEQTSIMIDWELSEGIWKMAGRAFQSYIARRKKQRDPGPRRILAVFLIGAHAIRNGYSLLTLDDRLFRAAFPRLALISI